MLDTMEIQAPDKNRPGTEFRDRVGETSTTEDEAGTMSSEASTAIETAELSGLTCGEAIDLMGVYLAHEMTSSQRDQFIKHIRQCPACHEKLLALEIYLHIAARLPTTNGELAAER